MIRTTVHVSGMMCSMCESHLNSAVRKAIPEAKKVSSSHTKNIIIFITEKPADLTVLEETVRQTGYEYVSAKQEPYVKKGLFAKEG